MDSFYDYIWDVTILEYLTRILSKACLCLAVIEGPTVWRFNNYLFLK